jgi:tetratricopeptide (TPR) repeat protein
LAAIGILGGTAVRLRRHVPALPFLLLCVAAALLPVSNLVITIGSIMAERFLYLPLAAFVAALVLLAEHGIVVGGWERERGRRRIATAAVVVVALVFSWRTAVRNRDWVDERALWTSAVEAVPDSAKAHKALAVALFVADRERTGIDRVIAEGERAVALRPDYLPALVDLGSYYLVKGDLAAREPAEGAARAWYDRSVAVLERARTLDQASARRFREKMLARGHAPSAIPDVGNGELYRNLSLAYVRAERLEDALGAYEQSRRLRPSDPTHYVDLSAVLARLGRWEEAAVALFEAVTLDPDNRDAGMRLVEIYRTFYPEGRAVGSDDPTRLVINLDDPAVRNHRCRAYDGLARIYTDARRPEEAAKFRELAAQQCRRKAAA